MKLTEKQRRFADYYIELGNASEAARKSGYSETYAKTHVYKLLENARIKSYIEERLELLKSKKIADQQEIMEFLTSVIRGEVKEPVAILDGEGTQRIEYLVPNVNVRKGAAVDLGKRYAMWTDKHQHEGNVGVTFIKDVNRIKKVIEEDGE